MDFYNVCVSVRRIPLLTRAAWFFSVVVDLVYASYFNTICHGEGQDLFVSPEAQPAPKLLPA